jgi:hypothetical protein
MILAHPCTKMVNLLFTLPKFAAADALTTAVRVTALRVDKTLPAHHHLVRVLTSVSNIVPYPHLRSAYVYTQRAWDPGLAQFCQHL